MPETKKYFGDGYTYFVSQGLGLPDGPWFTVRVATGKTAMHRVCSPKLPHRGTKQAAQADLDAYAKKHKLTVIVED